MFDNHPTLEMEIYAQLMKRAREGLHPDCVVCKTMSSMNPPIFTMPI